jgi:hypothetical protein
MSAATVGFLLFSLPVPRSPFQDTLASLPSPELPSGISPGRVMPAFFRESAAEGKSLLVNFECKGGILAPAPIYVRQRAARGFATDLRNSEAKRLEIRV